MASCIAILGRAGGCHILLNSAVDFLETCATKHWVLINWSRTWVNVDVVGEKKRVEVFQMYLEMGDELDL